MLADPDLPPLFFFSGILLFVATFSFAWPAFVRFRFACVLKFLRFGFCFLFPFFICFEMFCAEASFAQVIRFFSVGTVDRLA